MKKCGGGDPIAYRGLIEVYTYFYTFFFQPANTMQLIILYIINYCYLASIVALCKKCVCLSFLWMLFLPFLLKPHFCQPRCLDNFKGFAFSFMAELFYLCWPFASSLWFIEFCYYSFRAAVTQAHTHAHAHTHW